jgi:squalene-hopene/tetraprenyl-beta-curcumene cyclase
MAKTFDVLKLNEIESADGTKHLWKKELSEHLLSKQRDDGSWINDQSRQWMENDPNLVTGFVLLVLSDCVQ